MNLDQLCTKIQKEELVEKLLKKKVKCGFTLKYDAKFGRDWIVSKGGAKPRVIFSVKLSSDRFEFTLNECARAIEEIYRGSTNAVALMAKRRKG